MMRELFAVVVGVVLGLTSFGGLLAAFLLDTAIMPWAVAVMLGYVLFRVERMNIKLRELHDFFELGD